jgi:hypothetical protein
MCRVLLCVALLAGGFRAHAYSVLTHEAIIDTVWKRDITPLLLKHFPNASAEDLTQAHAYAYGGCIIQDMGYYPFGSKFFSDLAHYVRSGDFILAMLRDASDLNEYAFAVGSLAHYAADNDGHSIAVNPSVAIAYPKLERKFGPRVTYAENPAAHIKVEFGFDTLQVARGRYVAKSYHDFIGFQVSKPVLERAFQDTYSLELTDAFSDLDLALGTYRYAVGSVIPEMTKAAWSQKKDELVKADPSLTRRGFVYRMSRSNYRKEWDGKFREPGAGLRVLAFFIRVLPKVGPLRALGFKTPTPETARLFEQSFDRTIELYRSLLSQVDEPDFSLDSRDFDTGQPTRPSEYKLADDAYAKLAIKLSDKEPAKVDRKVLDSVLVFFQDLDLPYATRRDPRQWEKTVAAVRKLQSARYSLAREAQPISEKTDGAARETDAEPQEKR